MDAHQAKIYTAILITAIVFGGILVYFVISLVKHQRRNNELYMAKILAEITTLEKERTRLANDLHDELGPLLSAVKFKLSSIETTLPEDEVVLQETGEHIGDIIQRMRSISNDLMPNTLMRKGLIFAIEEFIYKLGSTKNGNEIPGATRIIFEHGEIPKIPNDWSVNIYRIVHEIVHNTIKHAHASILTIKFFFKENKLILTTEDNGIGFNYNIASKENTGLGLRSVLSRTEIMGGNMFIESKPGKGTLFTIEIPVT